MRITKAALAISVASVLFLTSCGTSETVWKESEEVTKTTTQEDTGSKKNSDEAMKKQPKEQDKKGAAEDKLKKSKIKPFAESKTLDLSLEEQEDALLCADLRDEMTEMMLTSAEGASDIPSMFGNFAETDEFIEIAQEANNQDIAQEAEDFAVMMKAFANYVNMGGSMDNLESTENLKLFEDAIMQLEGDEIFRMLELSQRIMSEQKETSDETIAYVPFETCASLGVSFDETSGI